MRGEIEIPHNFIRGSLLHLHASSLIPLQTAAYICTLLSLLGLIRHFRQKSFLGLISFGWSDYAIIIIIVTLGFLESNDGTVDQEHVGRKVCGKFVGRIIKNFNRYIRLRIKKLKFLANTLFCTIFRNWMWLIHIQWRLYQAFYIYQHSNNPKTKKLSRISKWRQMWLWQKKLMQCKYTYDAMAHDKHKINVVLNESCTSDSDLE